MIGFGQTLHSVEVTTSWMCCLSILLSLDWVLIMCVYILLSAVTEELRKHSWSGIPREVRPITWRLLSVSLRMTFSLAMSDVLLFILSCYTAFDLKVSWRVQVKFLVSKWNVFVTNSLTVIWGLILTGNLIFSHFSYRWLALFLRHGHQNKLLLTGTVSLYFLSSPVCVTGLPASQRGAQRTGAKKKTGRILWFHRTVLPLQNRRPL